ncbi:MAG: glycosyltransferase [Steroidobacteraceae bacterium]
MRILHVILSRGFAGTERATAEMCNACCEEHAVQLVVRCDHRAASGASIRDHLDARVGVTEVGRWFTRRALAREIDRFRPDVIHAHLRRGTRLLAKLRPPCATIATLHMWVNGPHFLEMDGLIVIAQWQKRDLGSYRGRVFDINESLVPHPRLAPGRVAQLRAELGAGPGDFLIGGVGRLARSKGFDTLIRAFLEARLPQARLALVGDGRERAELERLARGHAIRFTGFRGDVKDLYQALDLFVSPSRSRRSARAVRGARCRRARARDTHPGTVGDPGALPRAAGADRRRAGHGAGAARTGGAAAAAPAARPVGLPPRCGAPRDVPRPMRS